MVVLVIGGAGYIGSHAARALKRAGHEVIIFDNLSTGYEILAAGFELVKGDMLDAGALARVLPRADAIMHFAAHAYVGESVTNPRKYFHNAAQRRLGGCREPLLASAHLSDADRAAGVGVEAVQLGRDVELDELPVAQAAVGRDAVDALVVDRDAGHAGEVVVELRARAGAVGGEHTRGDVVELARGDARPDAAAHLADRLGDHAACRLEGGKVLRVVYGHPVILTDRMSVTAQRPSRGDELELTIDRSPTAARASRAPTGSWSSSPARCPGDSVRAASRSPRALRRGRARSRSSSRRRTASRRVADHPGAPWQVLPYEKQLEIKADQVDDALRRIGKLDGFEMEPIVPAASSGGTATSSSTASARATDGELICGFHAPGRLDRIVPVTDNMLASERGNELREQVLPFCRDARPEAVGPPHQQGFLRNLVIREGRRTGQFQVRLVTSPGKLDVDALQRGRRRRRPVVDADRGPRRVDAGGETQLLAGAPAARGAHRRAALPDLAPRRSSRPTRRWPASSTASPPSTPSLHGHRARLRPLLRDRDDRR